MKHYVESREFYRYCLGLRLALQCGRWRGCIVDLLDLGGACGDASLLIANHLTKHAVSAVVVAGLYNGFAHCWTRALVRRTQYIVDVTATQFDRHVPPVIIDRESVAVKRGRYVYDAVADVFPVSVATFEVSGLTSKQRRAVDLRARRYAGAGV